MRCSGLITALILLSVLAACRDDDVDVASPTQGQEPTAEAAAPLPRCSDPEPEDPWARYVVLRREIHTLLGGGLTRPAKTRREGEAWYADHEEEIRATCRRMTALAGVPDAKERIAVYTTYLRTEGQRTVEKLVVAIPALVSDPGEARGLFDLLTRFDKICADASPDLQ